VSQIPVTTEVPYKKHKNRNTLAAALQRLATIEALVLNRSSLNKNNELDRRTQYRYK